MIGLNLCAIALLSIQSSHAYYRDPAVIKENQIQCFFSQHIGDLSNEYYRSYGVKWNPKTAVDLVLLLRHEIENAEERP